uniref:Uncharacterized protein n=1 Tax=Setaria digitata TaxID=48799 RepID=A0A915PRQ2_9BILA
MFCTVPTFNGAHPLTRFLTNFVLILYALAKYNLADGYAKVQEIIQNRETGELQSDGLSLSLFKIRTILRVYFSANSASRRMLVVLRMLLDGIFEKGEEARIKGDEIWRTSSLSVLYGRLGLQLIGLLCSTVQSATYYCTWDTDSCGRAGPVLMV